MLDATQTSNPVQGHTSTPKDTNVWHYKPAWCQPWSIISTGVVFVSAVRWISHESIAWTIVGAVPILLWWYIFLVVYPEEFKRLITSGQQFNALSMTESELES